MAQLGDIFNNDRSAYRAALEEYAVAVLAQAKINIGLKRTIRGKQARRVATGTLQNDLTYRLWKRGATMQVIFTTKQKSTRDYADVIEEGRTPGSKPPPVAPILKWLKVKGIQMRDDRGRFKKQPKLVLKNKRSKTKTRATDKEWNQLAYVIARSIGRNGIEGIHYMRDAVSFVAPQYKKKLALGVKTAVLSQLKADKYITK